MNFTKYFTRQFLNHENPLSLGAKFRVKRIKHLLEIIENVYKKHGYVNIVDIGGRKKYWGILDDNFFSEKNISITVINVSSSDFFEDEKHFKFIQSDCCSLERFKDNSFHIAHSNSVIEHVGSWKNIVNFSNEVRRIAPNYFVQTPYFWFPIEPHCMFPFFHWLPKPVRAALVMNFDLGHWQRQDNIDAAMHVVERVHLLDKKMFSYLFPDSELIMEKFIFYPKSLIALRTQLL